MSSAESPEAKAEEAATETTNEIIGTPEPEFHVYVRHIGRDTASRANRRARAGHRRQGAILDNGLRIRKKGRMRLTKIALKEFVDNHERLFFYVDNGILEVIDPATMRPVSRDELLNMLHGLTDNVKVGDEILPPALITAMVSHPPTRPQDVTRPDMGEGAVLAAIDQHEAEAAGEANSPVEETVEETVEEEVEETLTEDELNKMNRKELDKLAKQYELDPKDYSTKAELIEALLGD